jgi:hypothetical protein
MISSITSDPIMMASVVLGSLSVALFVYAWKSGKSLNPLSGSVSSTSPFKFADKFRDRVKNEAQEQDEIPDLAVSQLDNLLSHAVAHGREIERAKGKNSDKLYKMVAITTLVSGLNFIGLLVLIFG